MVTSMMIELLRADCGYGVYGADGRSAGQRGRKARRTGTLFCASSIRRLKRCSSVAEEQVEKIEVKDEVSDVPCDKCGAMMVYKMGRFGRFLACPNFPECRNTKPIIKYMWIHHAPSAARASDGEDFQRRTANSTAVSATPNAISSAGSFPPWKNARNAEAT